MIDVRAVLLSLMWLTISSQVAAAADHRVRHGYVDNSYGQLHYTMVTPALPARARKTPLVMLPQTVNPAIESRKLFEELGRDRVVIAVDPPGVGGSDGPEVPVPIEAYAQAIAEGLRGLGFGARHPVDVMGLHTGALIAAELAIAEPRMVRRVALSGVYVVPEERWRRALATLPPYRTSAQFFEWFVGMLPRLQQHGAGIGLPDEDWGRITVESLRPLVRREFGHDAAFRYAARAPERLPKVGQPVLLLAFGDSLRQPTLDSRPLFHDARLVDLPQYTDAAWYPDAAPVAAALRGFLD